MRPLFAPLLVALSFLTLLPVGIASPANAEISRSRGWYPVVGLLYGLLLAGMAALCGLLSVGPLLVAALLVATLAAGNRFLHLDGLMDVCDGLWGGRTVARRLEIMRDSRVGAFAVAGAGCVLLVKYGALATLLGSGGAAAGNAAVSHRIALGNDPAADGVPLRTAAGNWRGLCIRRPALVGDGMGAADGGGGVRCSRGTGRRRDTGRSIGAGLAIRLAGIPATGRRVDRRLLRRG